MIANVGSRDQRRRAGRPIAVNFASRSPASTSTGIVDLAERVPQRSLRPGAGEPQARRQALDRVAPAVPAVVLAERVAGEHRHRQPLVDERRRPRSPRCGGAALVVARRRAARSAASSMPGRWPRSRPAVRSRRVGRARRAARSAAHRVGRRTCRGRRRRRARRLRHRSTSASCRAQPVAGQVDERRASGSPASRSAIGARTVPMVVRLREAVEEARSAGCSTCRSGRSVGSGARPVRSRAVATSRSSPSRAAPLTNVSVSCAPGTAHLPSNTNVGTAVIPGRRPARARPRPRRRRGRNRGTRTPSPRSKPSVGGAVGEHVGVADVETVGEVRLQQPLLHRACSTPRVRLVGEPQQPVGEQRVGPQGASMWNSMPSLGGDAR